MHCSPESWFMPFVNSGRRTKADGEQSKRNWLQS